MISLTEKAKNEILRLIPANNVLRIYVIGAGCNGYSYKMEFLQESVIKSDYNVFDMGFFKIIIDRRSTIFLKGTILDFTDGLTGQGFTFNNPNSNSSCGCGQSFST